MNVWKRNSEENNIVDQKIDHLRQQIPLFSKKERYNEIIDILQQIRNIVKGSVGETSLKFIVKR